MNKTLILSLAIAAVLVSVQVTIYNLGILTYFLGQTLERVHD